MMEKLLASVTDSEGNAVSPERALLLVEAGLDLAEKIPGVTALLGAMGAGMLTIGILKAAYLLGMKDGKAQSGITFVVAPETESEGL